MPDIFERRVNFKPFEYPELIAFKEAIRESYWTHDEFTFEGDIQDFHVNCSPAEATVIQNTMLAISQIEVSVKTFWAKLYDRMPKPEIAAVGMGFAECHKEGTEILTVDGWKDFREITEDTQVAQVDPETSSLSFTMPDRVIDKEYEGDLHVMDNQTYNFAVTPGHRFIYQTNAGHIREREVQDIASFSSRMGLPFTAELDTEENVADALTPQEQLKIALQADGSPRYYRTADGEEHRGLSKDYHTYEISVKKGRKKARLLELIERTGVERWEFDSGRHGYVKCELDIPTSWEDMKTFDWVDLSTVSAHWCQEFIDELGFWGGFVSEDTSNYKDTFMVYISTNKACVDKAQVIGTLAGYRARIGTHADDGKDKFKGVYSVGFAKRNRFSSITAETRTESYEGRVYCVTVPTGCIVTRFNDKVLISGNSEVRHADAYSHLLELLGLNEKFEHIEDIPAMADRVEYLDQYLYGAKADSDAEYAMSILLFSIFIEHVSLFSQFLIMLSFDRYTNRFRGISNAVEATSKEEQVHGLFGIELIDILREERPEWFAGSHFRQRVKLACRKAYKAEHKVLDWIFEDGELEHLPRYLIDEFLKDKFNRSLENVEVEPIFDCDEAALDEVEWFYDLLLLDKDDDFFQKRPASYSKAAQSFNGADLF